MASLKYVLSKNVFSLLPAGDPTALAPLVDEAYATPSVAKAQLKKLAGNYALRGVILRED